MTRGYNLSSHEGQASACSLSVLAPEQFATFKVKRWVRCVQDAVGQLQTHAAQQALRRTSCIIPNADIGLKAIGN